MGKPTNRRPQPGRRSESKKTAKPAPRRAKSVIEDDGEETENFTAVTPVGRFSWPYFTVADTGREFSDEKFKGDLAIPKDEWKKSKAADFLKEQIVACAQAKWGKKIKSINDIEILPFYDSDKAENITEKLKGCVIIRAKSKYPPKIVGPRMVDEKWVDLPEKEADKIKGGDYGRFVVNCATFLLHGKMGVNLYLNVVQFKEKGESLGDGAAASLSVLGELEVEMDDLPLSDEDAEEYEASEDDEDFDGDEDPDDEEVEEEEEEKPRRGRGNSRGRANGKDANFAW